MAEERYYRPLLRALSKTIAFVPFIYLGWLEASVTFCILSSVRIFSRISANISVSNISRRAELLSVP